MVLSARAQHILISHRGAMGPCASRTRDQARTLIHTIALNLRSGAEFADMARAHSDCPTGPDGGDLGAVQQGALYSTFERATFNMRIGSIGDPIETPYGFHLIRRLG